MKTESQTDQYPRYRSHYRPRSRGGLAIAAAFLLLFLLAQPPVVFLFFNSIEPRILGMPFLYACLLFIYTVMIGVLILARRLDL